MKMIILLALLSFTAAEWRHVVNSSDAAYYVADERTDRSEREVATWEKVVPRDNEAGREYRAELVEELERRGVRRPERLDHMTARHLYRCAEGKAAFESFYYHDRAGRIIAEDSEKLLNKWTSPAPDSVGETLMLDACKRREAPQ